MHSRNAFAERHTIRSVSYCRVEQIGGKRTEAGDSAMLHRNSRRAVSLRAIEGKITVTVHLTFLAIPARLRPSLGRLENALCLPLDHIQELRIAERTADGFGAA